MLPLQVGVKAFLKGTDGRYLLLHRSQAKYKDTKGTWDIVGGRIEPGAPLLENLRREIREETGLQLASEPKLVYAQDIIRDDKHVVRLTYVADIEGEPVLDVSENTEYIWLSAGEMRQKEDLDIYTKEILDKGLVV